MRRLSRREFLGLLGLGGSLGMSGCQQFFSKSTAAKSHVVVIGGGFAGATAAKYIRRLDAEIQVTLIEAKTKYITCPASNWLFSGIAGINDLTLDYQSLTANYGVKVVAEYVTNVDTQKNQVKLANGQTISYDRLVMSAGIDFRWDFLPGYHEDLAQLFPHAWQAGPQTVLLLQQMQAMPEGGVVVISVPAQPFRCPPGPYERASMMAFWLKQHKPKAKIVILDANSGFSKQKLFEAGWAKYFGYGTTNSLIEWRCLVGNQLVALDSQTKTLQTDFGDKIRADVLNIIPPQQAASIAHRAGVTDAGGWCPVEAGSSRSKFAENIHVIGDAANYAPIPKSAFAANSEAKACAVAVVSLLNQQPPPQAHWLNTCYSLITPQHGISIAGVYKLNSGQGIELAKDSGGVSRMDDPDAARLEAIYAKTVYHSLVQDSFT
jgi:sulfide dehydrogenase [flavocytochrome c] flavoprotein subunit